MNLRKRAHSLKIHKQFAECLQGISKKLFMNVLVVEDDRRISKLLERGLSEDGHRVFLSSNGNEAYDIALTGRFELIVLDVLLPGLDGFSVLRQLRQSGCGTPVLMLTARDAMADMVYGLDAGADDYLTKPFLLDVLLARVRALGRRGQTVQSTILQIGNLILDRSRKEASRGGRAIILTKKEYMLLELLIRRANQVVSRSELIEAAWGFQADVRDNTLDFYIHSLRNKINGENELPMLRTLRGLGYQLTASPEE